MNIFGPKSLSHILFYLFRALSILTLLMVVYIDLSFFTGNFTQENGRYFMDIPLTGTFIEGVYQFNIILTISLGLVFGSIFFFVLSNIFKALKQVIIFNRLAIRSLSYFTILNLVVGPVLYILIHFVIIQKDNYRDIHNLMLHIIFGIVALFLTYIFKRGIQENDLTI